MARRSGLVSEMEEMMKDWEEQMAARGNKDAHKAGKWNWHNL